MRAKNVGVAGQTLYTAEFRRQAPDLFMQNPTAPAIVLASSSPYRRGLLDRFLAEFEAVSPGRRRKQPRRTGTGGPRPAIAQGPKPRWSPPMPRDALIIGADQLAVLDGDVLGKPGSHQKAIEQLLAASGKAVRFLTAVCVLDPGHPQAIRAPRRNGRPVSRLRSAPGRGLSAPRRALRLRRQLQTRGRRLSCCSSR